jgi:hypothetical protein
VRAVAAVAGAGPTEGAGRMRGKMGRGPREKDEREGESGSAGKGEKGEEVGGPVGQQAKMERERGWK